jgi:hypothetical protein
MTWRWVILWVGIVCWSAETRAQIGVTKDLEILFFCKQGIQSLELEDGIERFLKREGFKVLNQARIQREHGVSIFDILIIGLDDKQRIFWFSSLPRKDGKYAVSLITPPPTRRSSDLEDGVLKLVSGQFGCDVPQTTRGENKAEAKEAFDRYYNVIKHLFHEAESLQGQERL